MSSETDYEQLWDRYRNGDIDRRTFMKGVGMAAAAAGVFAGPLGFKPGRASAASADQIYFYSWGGVVQEATHNHSVVPFTKASGIDVVEGSFSTVADFLSKVQASSSLDKYNIGHLSQIFQYNRFIDLGLGTVLDEDNIPRLDTVIPRLVNRLRKYSNGHLSAVPFDYGAQGIAYNRKHISDDEIEEKGAKILLDKKYKGRITGWSDWKTRVYYGAVQTGQDPNSIEDLGAVWNAVRQHRDLLNKYFSSGAQLMNMLGNGEVYVTDSWSGRIRALQDQGYDIGYYDFPGTPSFEEYLFVIKGSPMDACERFCNFMLKPEVAVAVAEAQKYPPSLDATKVDVGEIVPTLPAFDPSGTLENYGYFHPSYYGAHEVEWSRKFRHIKLGF